MHNHGRIGPGMKLFIAYFWRLQISFSFLSVAVMSSFLTIVVKLNNNNGAASFSLSKAVCNHGFFMLPPNLWIPSHQMLQRPIRLLNGSSYMISILQPALHISCLYIRVHAVSQLHPDHQNEITGQVRRMLRISNEDENDVRAFQEMHPSAQQSGFSRIFRSPSLFEDVVKTILLCSCGWKRSMEMAGALCRLECALRPSTHPPLNFPSSEQLACLDEATLNKYCNLGYRAKYVIGFARAVTQGVFNLNGLEEMAVRARRAGSGVSYSQVEMQLKKIAGAGDFVVANLALCLGFYHRVPIDSETRRHLRQVHGKQAAGKKCEKAVQEVYSKYAPYQCLAYWFELIDGYEKALGSTLSELPASKYTLVAGNCSSNN